jgi:hypothetical protein
MPLQIYLISWPIGRPPSEEAGVPRGRRPLGHNVNFKILQKCNYRVFTTPVVGLCMCKWGNIWGDTKGIIGGILRNIQWEYLGNIQEIVRGNTKGIIGGIIREYCLIECKTPYLLLLDPGFDARRWQNLFFCNK